MTKKRSLFFVWLIVFVITVAVPLITQAQTAIEKTSEDNSAVKMLNKTNMDLAAVDNQMATQVNKQEEMTSEVKASETGKTENSAATVTQQKDKSNAAAVAEKEKNKEEEQDMMERALDLLELADSYWERGDFEYALDTLDKAYALILDTNGDIEIARQKDDLRLLISKRILAIYSASQSVTNGKASEIPLIMNPDVEKEIRSFQGPEREFFISSYHRSGMFRQIMIRELKKAGLPEELSWLPLVESGFKISALSRARALGLWQFIPSTGYKFGLSRDEWIDERMDIEKSTHAAIAYLKELHGMFGDWMTVLAAYNCGEGRVLRVISRQHINYFDRFWDLYNQLPRETARYVPRFLATMHIIKNPQKYGMDLGEHVDKPIDYETVQVNKIMKLQDIAAKLEVSEDVLNMLNAELRYRITPDREYNLKIPANTVAKFNLVANEIPESEKPKFVSAKTVYVKHRVKKGETLATIARKYRVSTDALTSYNNISAKRGIVAGQRIRIPIIRQSKAAKSKAPTKIARSQQSAPAVASNIYKVKSGDTLLIIAKRFDVPVAQLKELNNLKNNSIRVGQKLRLSNVGNINNSEKSGERKSVAKLQLKNQMLTANDLDHLGTNKHIVTRGENLSIIAKKNNVSVAKIVELNNIASDDTLTPGQVLIVR